MNEIGQKYACSSATGNIGIGHFIVKKDSAEKKDQKHGHPYFQKEEEISLFVNLKMQANEGEPDIILVIHDWCEWYCDIEVRKLK